MVVHHIPAENPSTFIALYVAFTLSLVHHRSMLSARFFWKRNLKPLMTRRSFPFSLHITLPTFTGSIFTPVAWDTIGIQLLYLKTNRGTPTSKPRDHITSPAGHLVNVQLFMVHVMALVTACWAIIRKVTAGSN